MTFKAAVRAGLRRTLLIPNGVCPVCGKVLFRTPEYLCGRCLGELPLMTMKACACCGRPVNMEDGIYCAACTMATRRVFSGGYVWLHYRDGAKKLVAALKFGGRPVLGFWIGRQMAARMADMSWITKIEGIIPVPLHPRRLETRGYNQSAFLAQGMGEALGLPVLEEALIRYADTPHQLGLSRRQRMKNLSAAFVVKDEAAVAGKNLLLADDVITTGSTLRECAETLLAAGARSVYTAVVAAAPGD